MFIIYCFLHHRPTPMSPWSSVKVMAQYDKCPENNHASTQISLLALNLTATPAVHNWNMVPSRCPDNAPWAREKIGTFFDTLKWREKVKSCELCLTWSIAWHCWKRICFGAFLLFRNVFNSGTERVKFWVHCLEAQMIFWWVAASQLTNYLQSSSDAFWKVETRKIH